MQFPPRKSWRKPALLILSTATLAVAALPARAHAQECADAERHPEWIFCHDFEPADAAQFDRYWDDIYGAGERMFLLDENPVGVPGRRSMRLQVVNNTSQAFTSGVTAGPKKFLGREVDWNVIHYRRYLRFGADFHQGNFMHLGGLTACRAALYPWQCLGGAGKRPRGEDTFSSELEPWSDYQRLAWPGRWGFYSYYYRMFKDCGLPGPDDCYGDMFAPDPPVFLSRGAWHVLEMAIDPGTPKQADGSETFWLDGRKAFTAEGIAWRTVPELRVNEAGVYLYIHNNPAHTTNTLDVDNVLFSRRYIGPAPCADGVSIQAPCICGGLADPANSSNVHANGTCCAGLWHAQGCSLSPSATPPPTSSPVPTSGSTATVVSPTRVPRENTPTRAPTADRATRTPPTTLPAGVAHLPLVLRRSGVRELQYQANYGFASQVADKYMGDDHGLDHIHPLRRSSLLLMRLRRNSFTLDDDMRNDP